MGNMAILRIGGGLAALLMMGGCMSVESCDPSQVNNVVSSAMCQGGGYYDQRQANMGANLNTMTAAVEAERIAISQANSRIRTAEAQNRITAAEARSLDNQLAALNADVDRLARSGGQSAASQQAIRARIEARKQAINEYTDIVVF